MTDSTDDVDELLDDDLAEELEAAEAGSDDSNPEGETSETGVAGRAGQGVGRLVTLPVYGVVRFGRGIGSGVSTGLYAATQMLPGSRGGEIWKNIAVNSLRKYKKATGADAINLVARENNHIDPQAVKWSPSTDDDPESYWTSKSGEEKWHPGTLGEGVDLFGGKVPVILSHEDNIHAFRPVEATIAEVVDMDQVEDLVHYDTIQHVTIEQEITPGEGGGHSGQAVADGGVEQHTVEQYAIPQQARAQLEDVLIDPFSPDGHHGYRVSWSKTDELLSETTTTEEMQRQEDRGRIAEMDQDEKRDFVLKVLLYAVIAILGVTLGPDIINALFGSGGGGGGGGGVIPLAMGVLL